MGDLVPTVFGVLPVLILGWCYALSVRAWRRWFPKRWRPDSIPENNS